MIVHFTILGKPMAKGRPRFYSKGKYVKTYTPEKTIEYENQVRLSFLQAQTEAQAESVPMDGYVMAIIQAYFPIPKSFSKKKHEDALHGKIRPDKKPDCDNIAKTILDALNTIAFYDDKQVTTLMTTKRYSDRPRVEVILYSEGD